MSLSKIFTRANHLCDLALSSRCILTKSSAFCRGYKKRSDDDGCRRACVDIPPDPNPVCPKPCNRWGKKKNGILHKIKLRIMEGGSNFGTPFNRLLCEEKETKELAVREPKALPEPSKKTQPSFPPPRPGVQISILGADTNVGQYIALLLKQCPCVKKLRLYEAKDTQCSYCNRDLCKVVEDIQHIDTNCIVQAFSCVCNDLERCLQNSDIVVILESGDVTMDMPLETRFCYQAPIIKQYADAIAKECPNAFLVVCASPVDCMVPLIAETLKETGWYNPRKLLGSLAVSEMRASTLAARALCLEPSYVHVPCVGGTEGPSLVPLFSRALDYFDFSEQNSEMMTQAVRSASQAVSRYDGNCTKAAELSEAHALTGLVSKIAWALLCKDVPRVTGFVETDPGQVISPARFLGLSVTINGKGISDEIDLPLLTHRELKLIEFALLNLKWREDLAMNWYCKYMSTQPELGKVALNSDFFCQRNFKYLECEPQTA